MVVSRSRRSRSRQGAFLRGWKSQQPQTQHERDLMLARCGKKCFLGAKTSFPICTRRTCRVNRKGLYAAYIRAREYSTIKGTAKYRRIASKAKRMLRRTRRRAKI